MFKKNSSFELCPSEWYSINQFTKEIIGEKNPCISLYFPHDKKIETIRLLQETKRDEKCEKIEFAIEKRIEKLKIENEKFFVKTHCIFGWLVNGRVKIKYISVSKKIPYVYVASNKPYLKPFFDILKINYEVILVILDHKSAKIKHLQGHEVLNEEKISINLQGRHKKGGQSQKRFLRARQTYIQGFYKKITKKLARLHSNNVKILFLGGVGTAKIEIHNELNSELKRKCRFMECVSFGTDTDIINKKIINHLHDYRRKHVLDLIVNFENQMKEKLVLKKNSLIKKALDVGAVDTLLVSANYFHSLQKSRRIMKMIEMAENTSAEIEFITNPKLVEKLEIHDHIIALSRYKFK